jgi:protein SCO1/2
MTRAIALLAAAAVLVGLAVMGLLVVMRPAGGDRFAECRRGAVAGGVAQIGGPFTLTDAGGARVTAAEVITKPTLVYFGFTFCPDVCPLDLARNAAAADLLAERGIDVGQVFISVDPARDTPEAVGAFASAVHPELVGLTGAPEDVAVAADAYRVYYSRSGDDPEFYTVDHSTFTYLMTPDGFLEFYGSDVSAEAMADSVACFVEAL